MLILNADSSSLKFAVFRGAGGDVDPAPVLKGQIAGIGSSPVFKARLNDGPSGPQLFSIAVDEVDSHQQAIDYALHWITGNVGDAPPAGLSVEFDAAANAAGGPLITMPASPAKVWVIPTNEEPLIARHTQRLVVR